MTRSQRNFPGKSDYVRFTLNSYLESKAYNLIAMHVFYFVNKKHKLSKLGMRTSKSNNHSPFNHEIKQMPCKFKIA